MLLLALLLIWPGVRLLLTLADDALVRRAPPDTRAERARLYRKLRWELSAVGVLASLAVTTRVPPLPPPLAAVLNRLTVLILPLLALPTLRLRWLILAGRRRHGIWRRAAAGASLLVPAVFAVDTLAGLLGYVNLVWAVVAHLGWPW